MNSPRDHDENQPDFGTLFDGALPRPRAPIADRDAVFRSTHAAWVQTVAARRRRLQHRFMIGGAIAASLLLMLTFGGTQRPSPTPAVVIATLEVVRGDVMIGQVNDPVWRPLGGGKTALTSGTRLRTLEGFVRMNTGDQGSLRLNHNSVLTMVDTGKVDLEQGQLYFDSGPLHAALGVTTPLGTVRNQGTQFQVSVDDQAINVSVRTGRVILRGSNGHEMPTDAGEQQLFFGDGRPPQRRALTVDDAAWLWADALAPNFLLDGRNALEYLEWIAVETGSVLQFATPEARRHAQREVYTGYGSVSVSIETMTAALLGVGLEATRENGKLIVSLRN